MQIQSIGLINFKNNKILGEEKEKLEKRIGELTSAQADLYNQLVEKRAEAKAAYMKYTIAKKEFDKVQDDVFEITTKLYDVNEELYATEDKYRRNFKDIYRAKRENIVF